MEKPQSKVKVTFWGTRGSYPQSGQAVNYYGGKTSCVSVECGETLLILDGGTGLIDAGHFLAQWPRQQIHLLLSHAHLDHLLGLPFFKPLSDKNCSLDLYCGMAEEFGGIEAVLETIFSPPYFPVPWQSFAAKRRYHDFKIGVSFDINPGVKVDSIPLNHPGGGSGYRITHDNKSIVYLCDTDHGNQSEQRFAEFCHGADLLIYDATFTEEEYALHPTWGHSTWRAGVAIARAAGVKQLCLTHHDPEHGDTLLKALAAEAQLQFSDAMFAHQGQVILL